MSDSIVRFLSDSNLFIQIDWNDLVNVPVYIDDLTNCVTCGNIIALSASAQTLSGSVATLQSDVVDLNNQMLNVLDQVSNKVSTVAFNKHHHDCRYFTKNQLKYPNLGGEVNWYNLKSLPNGISALATFGNNITKNHILALSTPVSINLASSGNPFVTLQDLRDELIANSLDDYSIVVFDQATVSSTNPGPTRQSENIYDTYYGANAQSLTRDWSPLKYHTEYFVHRRNPYYDPNISITASPSQYNWVDEDVDGNKVWIGERHIFTGGKDGVQFVSGSSLSRATSGNTVGLPDISDLYNNVGPSLAVREEAFANRQVIVYGGVEIGRNLNMLPPISGGQILSAPAASASFLHVDVLSDMTIAGEVEGTNFAIGQDGSATFGGSISADGGLTIANFFKVNNNILSVTSSDIIGSQNNLRINKLDFTNGNLSISGDFQAEGDLNVDGNASIGSDLNVVDEGVFGGKLTVGGSGQISVFESGIRSDGAGLFFGDITGSVNTFGYKGFFGGDVLISGGLTIEDYFELAQDLTIHGDLTVDGDSTLSNNVTASTKSNSKFIIGQVDSSKRAGDTYIVNWTNSNTKVSTFRVFTREMGTSANILTMRMAEDNIFNSGTTVGPSGVLQNRTNSSYINGYSTWNGVDIRRPAAPYDVYKNDGTWSGLEIKTYLSSEDTAYSDSQYLLFTSNARAFGRNSSINGSFPGSDANTNEFPNECDNFGWVMSDWFRTATEKNQNPEIRFPLHLIASKNYVDYRMAQLNVAGSAFKVHPENLSAGTSGTPDINDIIVWDGSGWVIDKLNLNSQLWQVEKMGANGDFSISNPGKNTIYVITDEGVDAPFSIELPALSPTDIGLEIVIKFWDIPSAYFPIRLNGAVSTFIDGATYKDVTVPGSAIRLYVFQENSWIIV